MFKWKKRGCLFNPTEIVDRPTWMHEFAQAPCVIKFESFIRIFFNCRPKPDKNGQYTSYCGYADFDRSDLNKRIGLSQKPILPLGELGTFDEFGTYPVSVIKHQDQLLAYFGGWTRCSSVPFDVAIGIAESSDGGDTFKKIGNGPVLSYSLNEPFIISGPKIRRYHNKFYLFYIAGQEWLMVKGKPEPIYKIRLAISDDGFNWQKQDRNLIENVLGPHEAQASPDVIYINGKYHMFFCYREPSDFRRNRERGYKIGYASSKDLLSWQRDDSQSNLDISEIDFDNEMVAYPHVFELDGKIYMLYLGNQVGRYGFGIAELEDSSNYEVE